MNIFVRRKREWSRRCTGAGPFLWSEVSSERAQRVRGGQVVAQFWTGQGPVRVPNGLIHDWIGAEFVPATNLKKTLSLIQDYDNHKNIYKPEVIASRLISHRGNDFRISLRLLKKKIMTVVLDTDHEVHYRSLDPKRWVCRSYTTRIAEVEHAGTPKERVLLPDTGYGFLWRLYSYWRFQEQERWGVHRVSSHFTDARRAIGAGMVYRTDHPEAPQGVAD